MLLTVALGVNAEDRLHIQLHDSKFVNRWSNEFRWCLDNCEFDRNENFACFQSLEERKQVLLDSVAVINRFLRKSYKADFFELSDRIDQDWFNYLHEKFEQLSGTYENPSKLMSIAPKEVRQSIRNLNFFIHLTESYEENIDSPLYISFDKDRYRRIPLEDDDYKLFQFERKRGCLYLNYCELGKPTNDVFKDGLSLDYPALKDLHYFSGDCQLHLSDDLHPGTDFVDWLITNDLGNKRGIGSIELGKLEEDVGWARKILKKHRHLHSIQIEER